MAYVICEPCVNTKNADCTRVCPVDAIHPKPGEAEFPLEDQLYIDPARCIDCSLCAQVCPVSAIYQDSSVPFNWQQYIQINADYYS